MYAGERFLRVADKNIPRIVDAVVVLAGSPDEDRRRVLEGAAYYHQGRTRFIILPTRHHTLTWSWVMRHYKIDPVIPETSVIIGTYDQKDHKLLNQYGGTYIEAQKTMLIMLKYKIKTAVIVSSDYHMRRAKMAFEKARQNSSQKFFYHPVLTKYASDKPWWMITEYRQRILREYKKLLAAMFIY
jgi:hypothetical protein